MNKRLGWLLIAAAGLHTIVGVIMGHEALWNMLRAGLLDTARPDIRDAIRYGFVHAAAHTKPAQSILFWFLMTGFALFVAGQFCLWVERPMPRSIYWQLLGLGVLGVLCAPASGFWILIAYGIYFLTRKAPSPSET